MFTYSMLIVTFFFILGFQIGKRFAKPG